MHGENAEAHIETLLADLPRHCLIVTVIDGHPATLSWLGAVHGHRVAALGVEHFGQTGTVADLYRHFEIDRAAIVAASGALAPGRPLSLPSPGP
jgi:pyruvate dehydrogenase E1 component